MSRPVAIGALALAAAGVLGYSLTAAQSGAGDEGALARLSALEARLAELESALQPAADYRAIRDNGLQYTRGLDRHDEALINGVFWPDADVSYGELIDMDELAVWANESHAEYAAHQHHVTGLSLDIDGDTAHEEGYILYSSDLERDRSLDTDGAPTPGRVVPGSFATLGSGRYVNRYERRDGEWRIRVHEYVHDVSLRLEAVDVCATGCLGRWDRSDISYLRPLQPLSGEERQRRVERGMNPRAAMPSAAEDRAAEAQ